MTGQEAIVDLADQEEEGSGMKEARKKIGGAVMSGATIGVVTIRVLIVAAGTIGPLWEIVGATMWGRREIGGARIYSTRNGTMIKGEEEEAETKTGMRRIEEVAAKVAGVDWEAVRIEARAAAAEDALSAAAAATGRSHALAAADMETTTRIWMRGGWEIERRGVMMMVVET
jgi:hypothetical protein